MHRLDLRILVSPHVQKWQRIRQIESLGNIAVDINHGFHNRRAGEWFSFLHVLPSVAPVPDF